MSIAQETRARHAATFGAALCRLLADGRLAWALFAVALAQQSCGHLNADNSWLITVGERVLAGNVPYVDFIETNPPASFLLYLPAVALAHALSLPVEFVVAIFVFCLGGGCILLAGRILQRAGLLGTMPGWLANIAVFTLILLPGFSFAEREHVAAFGVIPLLAVQAARSQGQRVSPVDSLVSGVIAGLVVCIKPHFALAAIVPLGYVLVRRRSILPAISLENLAIVAVVIGYVALLAQAYPAFFDILPSLLDAYVSMKSPLRELVVKPWFVLNVGLIAGVLAFGGRRCFAPLIALPLGASVGFIGTFLLQGKGWVNHGFPGVSLALIAAGILCGPGLQALARGEADAPAWQSIRRLVLFGLVPAVLGAPILFGALIQFLMWEDYDGLTAAVRRHAPQHPRLIAVGGELDVGHPLVRRVAGIWVGRPHSLWLMICAQALIDWNKGDGAFQARLATYVARDARMFREDMNAGHPDLVLVDDDIRTVKALAYPDIAAALSDYAPVETVSGITLWARRR